MVLIYIFQRGWLMAAYIFNWQQPKTTKQQKLNGQHKATFKTFNALTFNIKQSYLFLQNIYNLSFGGSPYFKSIKKMRPVDA